MAQTVGGTYLERFVESCGPLPAELQRLLATLGELDERIADLRTEARSKFEQCMELPSQAARQSAPESGDQVAALRTEVEDAHKLMQQLSMEKVHLAATASELVSGYIRTLDRELGSFADELVVHAREAEAEALADQAQRYEQQAPMGGHVSAYGIPHQAAPHAYTQRRAGFYPPEIGQMAQPQAQPQQMAPPPQPAYRPPRANEHSHARKRQLASGDQVASNTAEVGENWIVTTFVGISSAGGLYEVQDEEAEAGSANRYFLEAHNVVALPRSASGREERALPVGTPVLGVFPGTTTFYRATVLAAPRRLPTGEFDGYTLQFEDDEVEGGQGRPVDFRHVVPVPS